MAVNVIVDSGFLVALITRRDTNHAWADAVAARHPPPWKSCESAISEAFYLFGLPADASLLELLDRGTISCPFQLDQNNREVLALMRKYSDVPMSFADACLVRMTEIMPNPMLLTTDTDFRIYRRHSRQVIPSAIPDR